MSGRDSSSDSDEQPPIGDENLENQSGDKIRRRKGGAKPKKDHRIPSSIESPSKRPKTSSGPDSSKEISNAPQSLDLCSSHSRTTRSRTASAEDRGIKEGAIPKSTSTFKDRFKSPFNRGKSSAKGSGSSKLPAIGPYVPPSHSRITRSMSTRTGDQESADRGDVAKVEDSSRQVASGKKLKKKSPMKKIIAAIKQTVNPPKNIIADFNKICEEQKQQKQAEIAIRELTSMKMNSDDSDEPSPFQSNSPTPSEPSPDVTERDTEETDTSAPLEAATPATDESQQLLLPETADDAPGTSDDECQESMDNN